MANSNNGNFLEDIYSSAKDLITERFSSPLIFSFTIAWLVTNFRPLVVIFTDVRNDFTIYDKLSYFTTLLSSSSFYCLPHQITLLINCFFLPLFLALLYVYLYPYVDLHITVFTLKRKRDIWNARVDAERGIKYTYEYVENIKRNHEIRIDELFKQISTIEQTNNYLRNQNQQLTSKFELDEKVKESKNSLEAKFKDLGIDLSILNTNTPERSLLILLGESNDQHSPWVTEDEIYAKLSAYSVTDIKIAIDNLFKSNLIEDRLMGESQDLAFQLGINGLKVYKTINSSKK